MIINGGAAGKVPQALKPCLLGWIVLARGPLQRPPRLCPNEKQKLRHGTPISVPHSGSQQIPSGNDRKKNKCNNKGNEAALNAPLRSCSCLFDR
jgi:hypothetical protein